MKNEAFGRWCESATALIRYGPDRKAVEAELMAHLEDHRDALVAEGMAYHQAQRAALAAMGDADAVAEELAKVHRPFWGYACRMTGAVAILLSLLVMLNVVGFFWEINHHVNTNYILTPDNIHQWEPVSRVQPDCSLRTDGYSIRVPEAVLWVDQYQQYTLCLDLQSFFPPWQLPLNCSHLFWAVDSLGNRYRFDRDAGQQPHILRDQYSVSAGVQTEKLLLRYVPSPEIQWVELHYDRDGRDMVLRIDLSGGEAGA